VSSAPADADLELSAIILCYRAEEAVIPVLERVDASLARLGLPVEIVLIANFHAGTDDRTPEIVRDFAAGRDNVRVVARPKEGAMGWDMRSGLAEARGRYLIVLDGDGQNPPETIADLYALMKRRHAHVGKGRRISRSDGLYRRLISFFYNLLFRLIFRLPVWDVNGKPKGLTRESYERMTLTSDDWFIDAEIVLEAGRLGLEVVELPVHFLANEERPSFVGPGAVAEFLKNMAHYRFRRWRR
jgi:glycosyltransferase involved in cell wall biosynthesis